METFKSKTKLCFFVFKFYGDLLDLEEDYSFVNNHLFDLDVYRLPLQTLICILSVTNPHKKEKELSKRKLFLSKVERRIIDELPKERHYIINGFK